MKPKTATDMQQPENVGPCFPPVSADDSKENIEGARRARLPAPVRFVQPVRLG
jgi:hypothetical protein